jgi:hypothetical protein
MANLPNAGTYDVRGTSEVLMHDEKRQRGGKSVTHAEHLFSSLVLFFSHGFFCKLGTHTSLLCAELLKSNLLCMVHL